MPSKSNRSVLHALDSAYSVKDFAALMFERRVVSISPAGIAQAEKAGNLALDYIKIGNCYFVLDSDENTERMRELGERRKRRQEMPVWMAKRLAMQLSANTEEASAPG